MQQFAPGCLDPGRRERDAGERRNHLRIVGYPVENPQRAQQLVPQGGGTPIPFHHSLLPFRCSLPGIVSPRGRFFRKTKTPQGACGVFSPAPAIRVNREHLGVSGVWAVGGAPPGKPSEGKHSSRPLFHRWIFPHSRPARRTFRASSLVCTMRASCGSTDDCPSKQERSTLAPQMEQETPSPRESSRRSASRRAVRSWSFRAIRAASLPPLTCAHPSRFRCTPYGCKPPSVRSVIGHAVGGKCGTFGAGCQPQRLRTGGPAAGGKMMGSPGSPLAEGRQVAPPSGAASNGHPCAHMRPKNGRPPRHCLPCDGSAAPGYPQGRGSHEAWHFVGASRGTGGKAPSAGQTA